jgi:hypothetical protein
MIRAEKRVLTVPAVVLGVFFAAASALAQMTPIYRFKNVQIPLGLKLEDKALPKGAYDLEFLRTSSPVLYFMKFMKGGKILGVVQGEEWPYAPAGEVYEDRSVPKEPTLKMTVNREKQLLNFIFESGKVALNYPMIRARFKLPLD